MSLMRLLVPVTATVLCAPAWAGPKEEAKAEHTRLREEMARLAARNAWRGVEASYNKMLALERFEIELSYEDHWMGAQAARDRGFITEVYERLVRARDVEPKSEVTNWIAEIDEKYGRVDLQIDPKYDGDRTLAIETMPFAPDQRAAIGTAQGRINSSSKYIGLLPFGHYEFGSQPFDVKADGTTAVVYLGGKEVVSSTRGVGERAPRKDGFRLDVGPAFSSAGGTSAGGVQAEAFSGLGLRAGLGFEVEITGPVGFMAEVGYQGLMLGGAGTESAELDVTGGVPHTDAVRDSMHTFWVWGAPTVWAGRVSLAAGPSWSAGSAQTQGVVDNGCASGSGTDCTENGSAVSGDGAAQVPVKGSIKSAGGTVGFFYGFMDMPGMKSQLGGLGLQLGAHSDGARMYPFGQLAFSIAPSGRRKNG